MPVLRPVGDNIQYDDAGGVVVTGGRNDLIGSASAGNTISNNGQDGLYVTGVLTGTEAAGNQIESNAGNGVNLFQVRGITIGGSAAGAGDQILTNQAYGVYGSGNSSGSVVEQNEIAENTAGNVDLSSARGITYAPSGTVGRAMLEVHVDLGFPVPQGGPRGECKEEPQAENEQRDEHQEAHGP